MRQIADVDGIEQPEGSFLQRRTHTPDPLKSVALTKARRRVTEWFGHLAEYSETAILRYMRQYPASHLLQQCGVGPSHIDTN